MGIKANEKYVASKLEEHKRDHSLYIAFAPLEAPTIAVAVVVENAGFGSEAAAPITRRVFDFALLGLYPSVEDMAATREGKSGAPIGLQRPAAAVLLPGQAAVMGPAAATGSAAGSVAGSVAVSAAVPSPTTPPGAYVAAVRTAR